MKKRTGKIIKDPKLRDEWAESVFVARANEQGLAVSRPWGDSKSFDFVVGRPGRFVGVQVKSTAFESGGGYSCAVKHNNQAYARGSFDFVAAYVIPENVWYIVPAEKLRKRGTMIIGSDSKQALYEEYREAWHLLREATGSGLKSEDPPFDKLRAGFPATAARSGAPSGEEMPVAESAEGGAEEAKGAASKYPETALERVRASMEFARRQLGLARPEGRDEDG